MVKVKRRRQINSSLIRNRRAGGNGGTSVYTKCVLFVIGAMLVSNAVYVFTNYDDAGGDLFKMLSGDNRSKKYDGGLGSGSTAAGGVHGHAVTAGEDHVKPAWKKNDSSVEVIRKGPQLPQSMATNSGHDHVEEMWNGAVSVKNDAHDAESEEEQEDQEGEKEDKSNESSKDEQQNESQDHQEEEEEEEEEKEEKELQEGQESNDQKEEKETDDKQEEQENPRNDKKEDEAKDDQEEKEDDKNETKDEKKEENKDAPVSDKEGDESKPRSDHKDSKVEETSDKKTEVSEQPKFARDHYDVCIIGAGLSGAVIAERYASQLGKTSLVLEKRDHIGGNCYDYVDEETGILMNKYGAHLFHTNYERVWEYIQQFSKWTPYEHRVLGRIGDKHVPIPVNIDTVNALYDLNISSNEEMDKWLNNEQTKYDHEPLNSEEMALSRVGPRLYKEIFEPYTVKQWAKHPKDLGPEVTARIPVRNNHDDRYFGDKYQALPTKGYTAFFENLLKHELIETHLNVDYFDVRDTLKCGYTYFTGPIDAFFSHLGYEKLEYRSLDFEKQVIRDIGDDKYHLPASVVNYPSSKYNFTRIVEYKHFLNQTSPHTVLFLERSKDGGDPYYPVPNQRNKDLYEKYRQMAIKEPNVTFVGRLANYKYFNMDQSIMNALELFDQDTKATTDTATKSKDKPNGKNDKSGATDPDDKNDKPGTNDAEEKTTPQGGLKNKQDYDAHKEEEPQSDAKDAGKEENKEFSKHNKTVVNHDEQTETVQNKNKSKSDKRKESTVKEEATQEDGQEKDDAPLKHKNKRDDKESKDSKNEENEDEDKSGQNDDATEEGEDEQVNDKEKGSTDDDESKEE